MNNIPYTLMLNCGGNLKQPGLAVEILECDLAFEAVRVSVNIQLRWFRMRNSQQVTKVVSKRRKVRPRRTTSISN